MSFLVKDEIFPSIRRTFDRHFLSVIEEAVSMAGTLNMDIFLVGGTVRDMLLGRKCVDIDVVTEADALALGKALALKRGLELKEYGKFGTCTVSFKGAGLFRSVPGKIRLDVATAREETYSFPGAMPEVRPSLIDKDLLRRDFTINAMAVGLTGENAGVLKDICAGSRDIKNGVIRILHENSFLDDPTRIFRAVRFEKRLSFRIDQLTEKLIKQAVERGMIRRIKENKIREEWSLLMGERCRKECLIRIEELLGNEMCFIRETLRRKEIH